MVKKLFIILAAAFFFIPVYSVMASDNSVISSSSSTIHVETEYNAYGVATSSTTTSTTTTVTTSDLYTTKVDGKDVTLTKSEDGTYQYLDNDGNQVEVDPSEVTTTKNGNRVTTTTTTTTHSSYHNGSLKADYATTVSTTTDGSGNVTSSRTYTDTYAYNDKGFLVSASGSGSYSNYTYDKDGNVVQSEEGTITRSFEVKDGQALLMSSASSGTIYDKNHKAIGTSSSSTTFTYAYKGGNWVVMQQVSTSTTTMGTGDDISSTQTITRTTTYTRSDSGVITGMTQTATGERTVYTSDKSAIHYTLENYSAEIGCDPQQGYYVSKESYDWVSQDIQDPDSNTPYDPWTMGTLEVVDGHLALVVDPNDVKGKNFYKMDPTTLTGETKKDENGNYIIMLAVEDESTKKELMSLVGHKINLMWQYYTKSSASDSSGYGWIWLAPTSDRRVNYHLRHDSESKVEQFGGSWDRNKQYVVLD